MKLGKTALLILILGSGFAAALASSAGQVKITPGSVKRGEQILETESCLSCHALNGRGGSRAPDFAKLTGNSGTPARLATSLWNHSPRMWAEYSVSNRQLPKVTSLDAADLFAYFYSTLYFAPPGDAARGKSVFVEKQCVSCHSEIVDSRFSRRVPNRWTELRDPTAWAERMWNHANEMESAASVRGTDWPNLTDQNIVDLMLFLSTITAPAEVPGFSIGEPELGRAVFERSCESCHSFGESSSLKVDLLARPHPSSVTGYIAAMWNHVPMMRRRGGSTPELKTGEMGDLLAFLFSQRYFFDQGSPVRGARVYEVKSCASCHENRRRQTGAPDLTQATEMYSPVTLAAAVWLHGPQMLETMKGEGTPWPEFQEPEMTDLIAYLNSRVVRRIGLLSMPVHFEISH